MTRKLTPKQRKFAEVYLANGRNAAEAYRTAYNTKASPKAVADEAARLLRHPGIAPVIAEADRKAQEATQRVVDRYAVTKERVTEALARLAFSNPRDVFDWTAEGVTLKPSTEISDDVAFAITEISEGEGGRLKLKLADKRAALMDLAKLKGWLIDTRFNLNADIDTLTDDQLLARIRTLAEQLGVGEGVDALLRRLEATLGGPAAPKVRAVQ